MLVARAECNPRAFDFLQVFQFWKRFAQFCCGLCIGDCTVITMMGRLDLFVGGDGGSVAVVISGAVGVCGSFKCGL